MKKTILMTVMIFGMFPASKGQGKTLTAGDAVPVFSLMDQNDSLFNISDYIGKKTLVIYFYPKDESSGLYKRSLLFQG